MVEIVKEKALILIDEANYYYGFRKKRWKIDYNKFLAYLTNMYDVLDVYFFAGLIAKKSYFDVHPDLDPANDLIKFIAEKQKQIGKFKNLKRMGYRVVNKPVASIYDNTSNTYKRKCNFDVEITLKAVDLHPDYETMVLGSGDGDFVKLVKYIKGKYKKTTIIGHKDRFNWELEKVANKTIFLEDIRDKIER